MYVYVTHTYTHTQVLGMGGFGSVVQALYRGTLVAVKRTNSGRQPRAYASSEHPETAPSKRLTWLSARRLHASTFVSRRHAQLHAVTAAQALPVSFGLVHHQACPCGFFLSLP